MRGIKLLREWLSVEQLAQFNNYEYFEVTGSQSGKRYRIRYGAATNIVELDQNGRPKTGWCFVPNQPLVPGDVMLAQLAVKNDVVLTSVVILTYGLYVPKSWRRAAKRSFCSRC